MKKKLLALLLSLTMCLGMSMTANAMPTLTRPGLEPLSGLENAIGTEIGQGNQNGSISYKSHYTELELNLIKSLFDPEYYAEQYPDVVLVLGNNKDTLWNHYVRYGLAEGRQINRNFNVLAYSAAYPDLQEAFGDDILAYYVHYMVYGKNEHRQLTTLEKAVSAGIIVTGMNGQIIAKPDPVVQKNSNNAGTDLSSAAQGTMNTNNNTSSSSGSEDKKPEETVCQHEYEVTKIVIEEGYHTITKKCKKCNNVVEGTPEDHNYDTIKECGNGQHSGVCGVCGAVDSSSITAHTFNSVPYDKTYHKDICELCGYYTEERHTYQAGSCTECGYDHEDHDWNSESGECSICKKVCNHNCLSSSKTSINTGTLHRIDSVCSRCGYVTIGEEESHSFGSPTHIEGTSTHKSTCVCGAEKIENCTSYGWNPDTDDEAYHFRMCQECNGKIAREKHNFSNGNCTNCGYSCREHQWNDGVCTVCKKICDHHEKSSGSIHPSGSSQHEVTYKCNTCNKEWPALENCDFERTEQIDDTYHGEMCAVCGNEINKAQHNFYRWVRKDDNNHTKSCNGCDYTVDEAHITDDGIVNIDSAQHGKVCKYCGSFFEQEEHTFEDGICTVCGEECSHTNTENVTEQIAYNAESHKVTKKCKDCGYVESDVTEAHRFGSCTPNIAYDYDISTTHTKVCSECQYAVSESCTEYRKANELESYGPTKHKVRCEVCGGIMAYEKHYFGPYGDMDNCMYCGYPKENSGGSDNRDDNVIIPSS